MDVSLEILKSDPAHLKLRGSQQVVLMVGIPPDEVRPIPRPGDVISLWSMDLTVLKLIHDWNAPEPRVMIVVYPELPIENVEELYWELRTDMETRKAEKSHPRISWVTKER